MLEEITVTVADIEALATKLEDLDLLDAHERATLTSVFLLAGQAVSYRADDVSGFSLSVAAPGELLPAIRPANGGLLDGFSWGLHGAERT